MFKESDFPDITYEYELFYLIVRIYIRLGDDAKATSYMKVFDQTKSEIIQKSKIRSEYKYKRSRYGLQEQKNLWQEKVIIMYGKF